MRLNLIISGIIISYHINPMEEFIENINRLIKGYSGTEHIGRTRYSILSQIKTVYLNDGYPSKHSIYDLSLIPFVFQECNYDDIWWGGQNEDLRHLSTILELDFMFHNEGKKRNEVSLAELGDYVDFSLKAIDHKTNRKLT